MCFPSINYIVEHTELNEKTVRSCLKKLQDMGKLAIERRVIQGQNMSNIYRLNWREGDTPKTGRGILPKQEGGYSQNRKGDTPKIGTLISKRTVKEPKQPGGVGSIAKQFILWWCVEYEDRFKVPYVPTWGRDIKQLSNYLKVFDLDTAKSIAERFLSESKDVWLQSHKTIPTLCSQWNRFAALERSSTQGPRQAEWR